MLQMLVNQITLGLFLSNIGTLLYEGRKYWAVYLLASTCLSSIYSC